MAGALVLAFDVQLRKCEGWGCFGSKGRIFRGVFTSLKRLMRVATEDLAEELPGRLSDDVPVAPPRSKVTCRR